MNPRWNGAISAALLSLAGCTGQARFDDPGTEAAVQALEQDAQPNAACDQGLTRVEQGQAQPDERLQALCRDGLLVAGADAPTLAGRVRGAMNGELATTLWLQHALDGHAEAYVELANQFAAAAGPADAPYDQLQVDTFAAALGAARRAAELGVDGATELLHALQDREYPITQVKYQAIWRAIYFHEFDDIEDSVETRSHIGGFALGIASVCEQWEVGIRSVNFDTALETYLAPVRSLVPQRVLNAVPQVGRTVADAFASARDQAGERSFAGLAEHGLRAVQRVTRDVRNSISVVSMDGRNAGQRLFNQVQSCRSPRGLKTIASLKDYFKYMEYRSPLQPLRDPAAQSANTPLTQAK